MTVDLKIQEENTRLYRIAKHLTENGLLDLDGIPDDQQNENTIIYLKAARGNKRQPISLGKTSVDADNDSQ